MKLGAATRRSHARARVAGLLSTTALLCVAAGSTGAAAAAAATAPYPPTLPCALSWSQAGGTAGRDSVLVGSGYDSDQPVAVTLYPQARPLGSYAADSSGSFQIPLAVSAGNPSTWVTASSVHRSCSVAPPTGTPTAPSTNAPTRSVTPGSSVPSSTVPARGGTNPSTGSGAPAGGTVPASGASGTPYPPTTPSSSAGATPGPSGATSGSGPTTPAPAPSTSNRADPRTVSSLGLPLSMIVVIAVLLLLVGALAVAFLTRRAG